MWPICIYTCVFPASCFDCNYLFMFLNCMVMLVSVSTFDIHIANSIYMKLNSDFKRTSAKPLSQKQTSTCTQTITSTSSPSVTTLNK